MINVARARSSAIALGNGAAARGAPVRCSGRLGLAQLRSAQRAPSQRCRAEPESTSSSGSASPAEAAPKPSAPAASQPAAAETNQPPVLQKGQGMAIVTGGISVVFGVLYLFLVFLMDSRGGQMLPPPPEAFLP